MRDVQLKFPRGKTIYGRYLVEDLLGTGGFGAVYRVRDRRVKENVFALKEVVNPNTYERNGLVFEGDLLKRLDHPALPHVYRFFEDDKNNRVYILMDYIDGPNLEKLRLRQPQRRLSFSQVKKIMQPIVSAVSYLHSQQPPIIHRDIKPSNIIVPTTDDGAVLVDFGIAKEYDQDSTTTAVRHASPGYGAPEHYARGTNTRTDIYSLAATCYTLLTGKIPVDALHRMTQISSKGVDPLEPLSELVPALPECVGDVLKRAMAINSNDRYATVDEFWQALDACEVEETPDAEPLLAQLTGREDPAVTETFSSSAPVAVGASNDASQSVYTEPPVPVSPPKRRNLVFLGLLIVIVFALIAGVAFGTGAIPGSGRANTPAPQPTARQVPTHAPSVANSPTVAPSLSPTAIPSPSPTAAVVRTPVPSSAGYPLLAKQYSGRIVDNYTTPATTSGMTLLQIQQNNAAINGYFSVGPELIGSGKFTGTVTTARKISFLVPSSSGLLPLFFDGQINADGSMAGNYCSYQNNRCNLAAGGYGTWSLGRP